MIPTTTFTTSVHASLSQRPTAISLYVNATTWARILHMKFKSWGWILQTLHMHSPYSEVFLTCKVCRSGFQFQCDTFPLKAVGFAFLSWPYIIDISKPVSLYEKARFIKKKGGGFFLFPATKRYFPVPHGHILTSMIWNFSKIFICTRLRHNSIWPHWGIIWIYICCSHYGGRLETVSCTQLNKWNLSAHFNRKGWSALISNMSNSKDTMQFLNSDSIFTFY